MPQYQWKGQKRTGETVEGVLSADNKDAVTTQLRKQQITVTGIKEKGKEMALPKIGGGVSQKEIAIFTRQFSVMIDAGLPLVQCLEILGQQQPNKSFQRTIFNVREDVEGGSSLADALKKHPKVFSNLYSNMVAAGEAGGILDTILQRLSVYIEKSVKLQSAVKSAMIYPIVVITVAVLVVIIILWKVIPVFASLFEGVGAKLPGPTRFVISLSRFLGRWFIPIVILLIAAFISLRVWYKTNTGKHAVDGFLIKFPVIGGLLRKIAVARFCRTLGTLITSGVPILEGLDITANTAGNVIISDAIMKTRKAVEEGKTLAEPLKETKVFPNMVTQMISVGEATGAMDAMLSKIADFYEEEVDTAVEGLMSLLEPVMIVFLGVSIGGIVIAMYLPLFTLIQQID